MQVDKTGPSYRWESRLPENQATARQYFFFFLALAAQVNLPGQVILQKNCDRVNKADQSPLPGLGDQSRERVAGPHQEGEAA